MLQRVPARISKLLPLYPSHCFRGCNSADTQLHIWRKCPVAQSFWLDVFRILSKLFNISMMPDSAVALLNLKPPSITHWQFKLCLQVTTVAKQTIAKAWKSPTLYILSTQNRVTQALSHAKIEAVLLDKVSKFEKLWSLWVEHYLPSNVDHSLLCP